MTLNQGSSYACPLGLVMGPDVSGTDGRPSLDFFKSSLRRLI